MTKFGSRVVEADTLSDGWLETVELASATRDRSLFHTYTTIKSPLVENEEIRSRCDALLEAERMDPIETVASTIFPAAFAARSSDPSALVSRYRSAYPRIRRFDGNHRGTYFGRLVAHPGPSGVVDQLVPLIERLRSEAAQRGPMSARYEVNVGATDDLPQTEDGTAALIHASEGDNSRMGFPCLSACSFQLDHGRVHLLAHYRYEYLIQRGYGNYLGLARLLEYVALSADLKPGQLTIVAGRVRVDAADAAVSRHLHATIFDGV